MQHLYISEQLTAATALLHIIPEIDDLWLHQLWQ